MDVGGGLPKSFDRSGAGNRRGTQVGVGFVTPVSIVRFTLIMPLAVPYIGAFYEPVAERSAEYAENMVNLFKGHYGLMVIGVFLSYLWEEHLEKRRVPPA